MSPSSPGEGFEVRLDGGQGVQVGSNNSQTNLGVDPTKLPPPQRVGAETVVHNLPAASAVFVGRDLAELRDRLGGGGAVVGQAAVHGLGGIGKSELANHYARTYLLDYTLVWWITADSAASLDLGLVSLTRRLHPVATLADARTWAIGWLQANTGWLLILDNVEDVNDIADVVGIVGGRGHVLVTTRRDLGTARWVRLGLTPLSLGVLPRQASIDLLLRLTRLDDAAGANRLADDLGDLPLALEQAAAYISQHHRMTFDDYRGLAREQFLRIAADPGEGEVAQRAVAAVWTVTINTIARRRPFAVAVLSILGWFAPDDVPADLCKQVTADQAAVEDALALLVSYSMITRSAEGVRVHRLVQAVTRTAAEAGGTAQVAQRIAIGALAAITPDDPVCNVAGWPRWDALLPHIDALVGHLPPGPEQAMLFRVRDEAASYRLNQGQVTVAIAAWEDLLADVRQEFGEGHGFIARVRHNLANACREAGRVTDAIVSYEGLLADQRRVWGEDHPSTLMARNNLCAAYLETGRVTEAIKEFERLVADRERALGTDHPDTLISRSNLANAYGRAGRVSDAIAGYRRVLADGRRVLGEDHPHTLTARNNLSAAYLEAGQVSEAITEFQGLIADRQRVLGRDHPDTLRSRHNLAGSYRKAGRVPDAILEFEELVVDQRRVLGADHPTTLVSRASLAVTYHEASRASEAVVVHEELVADQRRVLGEDHPNTLMSRSNLAASYQGAGRIAEAIALFGELLPDLRRVLGEGHPATVTSRGNLGAVYLKAGRVAEAIVEWEGQLADHRRVLPEDYRGAQALADRLERVKRAFKI